MKKLSQLVCGLLLAVGSLTAVPSVSAREPAPSVSSPTSESNFVEHGHYTNRAGRTVHSPAHTRDGRVPEGATARCGDGSYSFSQSHRGTCSRHGGVSQWL